VNIQIWLNNLKSETTSEDLAAYGTIILKRNLKKQKRLDLLYSKQRPVMGFCEHDNEHSASNEGRGSLEERRGC
jgi:hypothetical protein